MVHPGRRLVATCALAALLGVPQAPTAHAADPVVITRVRGADRVATAVELSRTAFPDAAVAVLATSASFADALAGAPLAARVGGPLLLTPRDRLDARVADELARLGVSEVVLLGGTAALAPAVEQAVARRWRATRLSGPDRFATARRIAQDLLARGARPAEVVVALGRAADADRAWPDALAAGALAGHVGAPILLVDDEAVPSATLAAMQDVDPSRVTVVGGTAAVSDAIARRVADGRPWTRASGPDRYATAVTVAERARAAGATASTVVVASGRTFADALAAGPAAVALDAVLVLADPGDLERSPALLDWLDVDAPDRILVAGGTAALTAGTDGQLRRAVEGFTLPDVELVQIGRFDVPLGLVGVPGDPRRFVIERDGLVKLLRPDSSVATILDIRDLVGQRRPSGSLGGEYGLLGIALHPDFLRNGRMFLHHNDRAGATTVVEYVVGAGDRVDPATRRVLYSTRQPSSDHNGGTIAFGPDGMLYLFLGDSGGTGDPRGRSRDPGDPLGAILRMDVETGTGPARPAPDNPYVDGGGDPFVWSIGVRNAFRAAFDPVTDLLWIADVGQDAWEEINLVVADPAGYDFGWNVVEGNHCYPETVVTCDRTGFQMPFIEYGHDDVTSVTGGYVHRGRIGMLRGHYFHGDFVNGTIRSVRRDTDGRAVEAIDWTPHLGIPGNIFSFGQDGNGELYVMTATAIHQLVGS